MPEGARNEPKRPNILPISLRHLLGLFLFEHPKNIEKGRENQENQKQNGGEESHCDEIEDEEVLGEHNDYRENSRISLPKDDRQCPYPPRFIKLIFINVLPQKDGGYSQGIGEGSDYDLPAPFARGDIIGTADHKRSPDDENRQLPHPNIFEWKGIEEQEEGAGEEEVKGDGEAEVNEINADDKSDEPSEEYVKEMGFEAHKPVFQGLGTVLDAEIIIPINALQMVYEVVEKVVGSMGEHQSQCAEEPGEELEFSCFISEEPADGGG